MILLDLLLNNKVIITVGTGGVGKTTLSAAMGLLGAELGKKTLVLTIDPAKRLASALGIDKIANEEVRVSEDKNLYAAQIDPKSTFDKFIEKTSQHSEVLKKLLNNKLYKQLSTQLAGSQEFTSIERLYESIVEKDYDLIILDTPPSQHAIEFLMAPTKIHNLFQDKVIQWFNRGPLKSNVISKIFSSTTRLVIKAFERLTGSEFLDELFSFFELAGKWSEQIVKRTKKVNEILFAKDTAFIVVSNFEQNKLEEASQFIQYLIEKKYPVKTMLVNKTPPLWTEKNEIKDELLSKVRKYYLSLEELNKVKREQLNQIHEKLEIPIGQIVNFDAEIIDIKTLELVKEALKKCHYL